MHRGFHHDDDEDDEEVSHNHGGIGVDGTASDDLLVNDLRRAVFAERLRVEMRNFLHAYFVVWHATVEQWRLAFRFQ